MTIYAQTTQGPYQARRDYKCNGCPRLISKGEEYYRRITAATMDDAGRSILRYHYECKP